MFCIKYVFLKIFGGTLKFIYTFEGFIPLYHFICTQTLNNDHSIILSLIVSFLLYQEYIEPSFIGSILYLFCRKFNASNMNKYYKLILSIIRNKSFYLSKIRNKRILSINECASNMMAFLKVHLSKIYVPGTVLDPNSFIPITVATSHSILKHFKEQKCSPHDDDDDVVFISIGQ